MSAKIIFVYNADTGLFNFLSDWVHKVVSPSTYSCSLCALTHHNFGAKEDWKEFVKQSPIPMEFLHKDEFVKKYGQLAFIHFPCVVRKEGESMNVIVSTEELHSYKELSELKTKIKTVLYQS